MAISKNDSFTIEWVVVEENHLCWMAIINLECYGSILRSESDGIVVLGWLKCGGGISLNSGDPFVPRSEWNQVVIVGKENVQNFVMHLLAGLGTISDDDILDLAIGLMEALDEQSEQKNSDIRLN